ncbi:MAG: tRNA epoxyqueuosine(34) reductase QueG [Alphaproteobacteria bacterium]|nr:tRNA epoxyqueuosine(34) reductase QueG [Alphaproteobacteria bacterium]
MASGVSKDEIRAQVRALGFDAVGFAPASLPLEAGENLTQFLTLGRHGEMAWMEARAEQRSAPQALWPEARSVIMLGVNYGPDEDPLAALTQKSSAAISVYAQNKDYHQLIKKRLKRLARWLIENHGGDVKVFVDTAPVMEKPLATKAGIGWQGKHTNLVSREFGSWLFLGSIFTTLDIDADAPETDHCGSCQNCLDICPTNAFPAPYQLDARRCLSYLTIEHGGPIPARFRKAMGNRIYGCDDCLAVCPWNKFASLSQETAFHAREELRAPSLGELAALDDRAFRDMFSGSPIKRTGRNRFVRNVLIAIGNSQDRALAPSAQALLDDDNALVRGAAIWALRQLLDVGDIDALRRRFIEQEKDADALAEWAY